MSEDHADRPADARMDTDAATAVFVGHRELLFSIGYNLLGSVADTEDVLQETWLSWMRRNRRATEDEIENPRAYLVRITVNQVLARQASISRRREAYVGPWLPEPIVTDTPGAPDIADSAVRSESVSMALLVVLETLTPLERVVFVLHDVFGYTHTEIAGTLDRSPPAVRQLAHRAREHIHARRPRYRTDPHVQQRVTERFTAATFGGDLGVLMEILAPDVTLWTDGGGKASAAGLRPIQGRDKVARVLSASVSRSPQGLDIRYRYVNGDPSVVLFVGDSPYAVFVFELTPQGDQIYGIYGVTNPEKLSRVG